MNRAIDHALSRLLLQEDLSEQEMESAIAAVMEGDCSEVEIGALLTALRMKGEAVTEIVGAARAMRQRAAPVPVSRSGLLDTCGTGGDGLQTFNISTAAALVAAAAGVPVAKHGNRSVSSTSGSSDVLEALGVGVRLLPEQVAGSIEQVGIGFCFAPLFHQAMKHAAPVRRELGFRTIFNLLGPLTNPAGAEYQLLGANRVATAEKLAQAAARLGGDGDRPRRALVVCGNDELDEVALWGQTAVFIVSGGAVSRQTWTAETLGLPPCRAEALRVESPQQSAEVIRGVFRGEAGPARDVVVANAAAALLAAERAADLGAAVRDASEAITSGRAAETLERLIAWTNSCG